MPSDSETGYVYTLSDPRTDEPRYVGATKRPNERYQKHISDPHSEDMAGWVKELSKRDMTPDMNIVQIDSLDSLAGAERRVLERVSEEHDVLNTKMNPSYPDLGPSVPVPRKSEGKSLNEYYNTSDNEEAILDVLSDGRATPQYLKEETGLNNQQVNYALNQLMAAGWVRKITTGLYEYIGDPREEATDL